MNEAQDYERFAGLSRDPEQDRSEVVYIDSDDFKFDEMKDGEIYEREKAI